jgi:hypothetical protein
MTSMNKPRFYSTELAKRQKGGSTSGGYVQLDLPHEIRKFSQFAVSLLISSQGNLASSIRENGTWHLDGH